MKWLWPLILGRTREHMGHHFQIWIGAVTPPLCQISTTELNLHYLHKQITTVEEIFFRGEWACQVEMCLRVWRIENLCHDITQPPPPSPLMVLKRWWFISKWLYEWGLPPQQNWPLLCREKRRNETLLHILDFFFFFSKEQKDNSCDSPSVFPTEWHWHYV